MLRQVRCWWMAGALLAGWAAADTIGGRVVDENGAPVAGARIMLECGERTLRGESDAAGRFEIAGRQPGRCGLRVEKAGFFALVQRDFQPPRGLVDLVLNRVQEYEEHVEVVYAAPALEMSRLASSVTLRARDLADLPYASTHDFRNALVALSGVVQDRSGRVHLHGGAEDQALYTLNGFDLRDPHSGIMELRIPADAVREVEIHSSRYSPRFGKSSAGIMAIESGAGDDRLRYGVTNFIPTGRLGGGAALLFSKWTPRGFISGPWRQGRAWFFNAADAQYSLDQVDELPRGANRNGRWLTGDLLRNQFLLSQGRLLGVTFLWNRGHEGHQGLGPRDPLETTREARQRNYHGAIRFHQVWTNGLLMQAGVSASRLRTLADPLGAATYRIAPEGRSGNHFEESLLRSRREEALLDFTLPLRSSFGKHELQWGAGGARPSFDRDLTRRPFEVLRANGTVLRRSAFVGQPRFGIQNLEQHFYFLDRWQASERVIVEAGLRQDWNRAAGDWAWSPRLAAAWAPFPTRQARLIAGWGLFYETVTLQSLSRPQDSAFNDVLYCADGSVCATGALRFVTPPRFALPRASNFSAGWEQRLPGLVLRAGYLSRRTSQAFTYVPWTAPGVFVLSNQRRDRYHAAEFSVEHALRGGGRVTAAYTRSSAQSTAVLELAVTDRRPGVQGQGPLDWDATHRALSSAWIPLGEKYGVAYLLEWRTGYPFSVFRESGALVGQPNSRRYPAYFNLNVEVERRFRLGGFHWAVRGGAVNVTGRQNPNSINNVLESPGFLGMAGGQKRALVARIRLLGRK